MCATRQISLTHSLLRVTGCGLAVGRSALHVDRSSATVHASAAVSPVSRTIWLIHEVRGRPAGQNMLSQNYSNFISTFRNFLAMANIGTGSLSYPGCVYIIVLNSVVQL